MSEEGSTLTEAVRAAGYIRVSQARNVDRHGLDAQEADVDRYVVFMQWELTEVYREEDRSPFAIPRPSRRSADSSTPTGTWT